MSLPPAVQTSLYGWVELFMFQSMRDLFRFLKEAGWSMTHYLVFMQLYKGGPSTISDLASFLGVSNAAVSQMVDGLVRQGVVTRAEATDDRRFTHVTLTEQGRAVTEQCIAARYQWLDSLPALTPPQQQVIIAGLDELTKVVRHLDNPAES